MSTKTLFDLSKIYSISPTDIALFITIISSMPVSDKISSNFGNIIKVDDNKFEIQLTEDNISKICSELCKE